MTYLSVITADSPLNLWKFDETSGTVATDSIGSNNGVIGSSVVLNSASYVSGSPSFLFDGTNNSYISLPAAMDDSAGGTFECWVNFSSFPQNQVFFMNGDGSFNQRYLMYVNTSGKIIVEETSVIDGPAPLETLNTGQWYYVVLTYDLSASLHGQFKLYIDGSLQLTWNRPDGFPSPSADAMISGRFPPPSVSNCVSGNMQWCAWYGTPLTETQITNHFAAGPVGGDLQLPQIVLQTIASGTGSISELPQIALQTMSRFSSSDPKLLQIALQTMNLYTPADPRLSQIALQTLVTYGHPVNPGVLSTQGVGTSEILVSIPPYTQYTTGYDLYIAPDDGGVPGTYVLAVTNITPNSTYTDTDVVTAVPKWYKLRVYNRIYSIYSSPDSEGLASLPGDNNLPRRYRDELYQLLPEFYREDDAKNFQEYYQITIKYFDTDPTVITSQSTINNLIVSRTKIATNYGITVNFERLIGHSLTFQWTAIFTPSGVSYAQTNNAPFSDVSFLGTYTGSQGMILEVQVIQNAHMRGYTEILGDSLDQIYFMIQEVDNFTQFQDEWFNQVWCEVMGFQELPNYLSQPELDALIPWLLRLYKLKGTMVPINVITNKVLTGSATDIVVGTYNQTTRELIISANFSESVPSSTTLQKMANLQYILQRFLPIYVILRVAVTASFVESYVGARPYSEILHPPFFLEVGGPETMYSVVSESLTYTMTIPGKDSSYGFLTNNSSSLTNSTPIMSQTNKVFTITEGPLVQIGP